MPEYSYNPVQNVLLGEAVLLDNTNPCKSGFIFHEDGTGVFLFRGVSQKCYAQYSLHFTGNIAIPADGTAAEPIALAFAINGETKQTSRAIVTPTVVDDYFHVSFDTVINIPRGTSFTVSVRAVSGVTVGATGDPAPSLNVQNAKLTITKEV